MTIFDDYIEMQRIATILLHRLGGEVVITYEEKMKLRREGWEIVVSHYDETMQTAFKLKRPNIYEDILNAYAKMKSQEYVTYNFTDGVGRKNQETVKATAVRLDKPLEITDGRS